MYPCFSGISVACLALAVALNQMCYNSGKKNISVPKIHPIISLYFFQMWSINGNIILLWWWPKFKQIFQRQWVSSFSKSTFKKMLSHFFRFLMSQPLPVKRGLLSTGSSWHVLTASTCTSSISCFQTLSGKRTLGSAEHRYLGPFFCLSCPFIEFWQKGEHCTEPKS